MDGKQNWGRNILGTPYERPGELVFVLVDEQLAGIHSGGPRKQLKRPAQTSRLTVAARELVRATQSWGAQRGDGLLMSMRAGGQSSG